MSVFLRTYRLFKARDPLFQWLVLSFLKSAAAAVAMSVATTYATAMFAVYYGFRVPVEGVPFLSFTVGLLTFGVLTGSTVAFGFLMLSMRLFRRIRKRRVSNTVHKNPSYRAWLILSVKLILLIGTSMSVFAVLSLIVSSNLRALIAGGPLGALNFGVNASIWVVGLYLIVACLYGGLLCYIFNFSWIIGQAFTYAVVLAALVALLFTPSHYASFLRVTRLGGGVSIVVHMGDKAANKTEKRGHLLITTEHYLIILEIGQEVISTISVKEIENITHSVRPGWRLPSHTIENQGDLIE